MQIYAVIYVIGFMH